jgi:hypothetical protein
MWWCSKTQNNNNSKITTAISLSPPHTIIIIAYASTPVVANLFSYARRYHQDNVLRRCRLCDTEQIEEKEEERYMKLLEKLLYYKAYI